MDVARFLIRTSYAENINETINVKINNGLVFRLKMVEDIQGLLRIMTKEKVGRLASESESESKFLPVEKVGRDAEFEVPI